ncbi:hypothetical protein OF83DRAFT_1178890 [Amylostereum chailletii]|nr:hypothetical protein OF83DRAFT_1178890 [Amylostereum chailletii]
MAVLPFPLAHLTLSLVDDNHDLDMPCYFPISCSSPFTLRLSTPDLDDDKAVGILSHPPRVKDLVKLYSLEGLEPSENVTRTDVRQRLHIIRQKAVLTNHLRVQRHSDAALELTEMAKKQWADHISFSTAFSKVEDYQGQTSTLRLPPTQLPLPTLPPRDPFFLPPMPSDQYRGELLPPAHSPAAIPVASPTPVSFDLSTFYEAFVTASPSTPPSSPSTLSLSSLTPLSSPHTSFSSLPGPSGST